MHALLIGATGATGKDLLELLLKDDAFDRVDIFVRRSMLSHHEKLHEHVIDFDTPEKWKHLVHGDVLFSCLGTTLKDAGSKKAQWKIDFEYQYSFAKAASANYVQKYVLVSSGGANPQSMIFYTRMKGELEVAVNGLGFSSLTILKPPLLIRKSSDRPGEIAALKIIRLLNNLGLFRSQRPMPTEVLAQAMVTLGKSNTRGVTILKSRDIWQVAEAG